MNTRTVLQHRLDREFEPFPRQALDESIGARFEEICRRFPDKTAVRTKNCSWTYAELNARADSVAGALGKLPIESPAPIALLFEHDAPGIAAILGVLQCGHFYCALDPAARTEHNRAILQALDPAAVLCDAANLEKASGLAEMSPVLNTDTLSPRTDTLSVPEVPAAMLAYVFFTSGTTGKPKGVMDSHRNVLHNILRYTNTLQVTAADRLTLLQNFSFSGSVSSLFCALLNGGTVYPFDLRRGGSSGLADWLAEQEITIYHSVPSIFRLIAGEGRRFPHMRMIRLEGDQATVADAALFQRHFHSPCVLVNGLGATECGIVRQFFLRADSPLPSGSLPIGHSVADMEVAVLDDDGRMVKPGESGEIAVTSRYLALGYWQRPELTELAFRPSPDDPAARVYRTGDLGQMDESGCLRYLGRKDFQEKVRGQRVDLTAVETEMLRVAGVAEAVAAVRPGRNGENDVVAYYTEDGAGAVDPGEVLKALRSCIEPGFMPAALVKLDRLPLNANGKVDRRALPLPGRRRSLAAPVVAPKNQEERALLEIWRAILALEEIGVEDSFLDLGGDSLQAMRMLARARQLTGRDASIAEFFADPTISGLAKILRQNESSDGSSGN